MAHPPPDNQPTLRRSKNAQKAENESKGFKKIVQQKRCAETQEKPLEKSPERRSSTLMACNRPLKGWVKKGGGFTASRSLSPTKVKMTIPCGQCTGCRLAKAREWTIRCIHEAQMHSENSFVTLTYNDENLPKGGNLNYEDFQLFMKKLRNRYCRKRPRFYMCAEYGDNYGRPHYHVLLFGLDFHDKQFHRVSEKDNKSVLYRSPTLETVWDKGFSEIGEVNYHTAQYVAQYIFKKQKGLSVQESTPDNDPHAWYLDEETGELVRKREPFTNMSLGRRSDGTGGLGYSWYQKYKDDLWPEDRVVLKNGKTAPVPAYYSKLLEEEDPELFQKVRQARKERAKARREDNTFERQNTKEKSAKLRLKHKDRNL